MIFLEYFFNVLYMFEKGCAIQVYTKDISSIVTMLDIFIKNDKIYMCGGVGVCLCV